MPAAFVRSAHGSSTTSSATIAAIFASNVAPDCDIEVVVVYDISLASTAHVTQVQDTLGNVYALKGARQTPNANGPATEVWRTHSATGGANTVTATISVAVPAQLIAVHEVSGVAASPDDGVNGSSNVSASTFTTGVVTPAQAGEFFFGGFGWDSGFGATVTQVSPFVIRENFTASAGGWGLTTETGVQSTAQAITASASAASPFGGVGISLVAVAASGSAWVAPTRRAPGQRGPFDQRGFLLSPYQRYSYVSSAPLNAYTLTADLGAFALSGNAANLLAGRVVTASLATFALTGNAANLLWGHVVTAAKGTFTETGLAANLLEGHLLGASTGVFVLAGVAASLTKGRTLTASAGAFTLAGQPAALVRAAVLSSLGGTFALAGVAANLLEGRLLTAATGSFTLSGVAATLTQGRGLTASLGTFALSGIAATLTGPARLTADAGTFGVTGQAATLSSSAPSQQQAQGGPGRARSSYGEERRRHQPLTTAAGTHRLRGQSATLRVGRGLAARAAAVAIQAQDAALVPVIWTDDDFAAMTLCLEAAA